MKPIPCRHLLLSWFSLVLAHLAAAATLPAWLTEAMQRTTPPEFADAPAVYLTDEMDMTVSRNGDTVRIVRKAVRLQSPDGRPYANISFVYNQKSDKVSGLKAWLIPRSGDVREYKDKEFIRMEESSYNNLYDETWRRGLSLYNSASTGAVIAYTYEISEKNFLPQEALVVRDPIPSLWAEARLTLPTDWQIKTFELNLPPLSYREEGDTRIWSAVNQPAFESEDWAPLRKTLPILAINLYASARDQQRARFRDFDTWQSIAAFHAVDNDPQAVPDAAIRAKVAELTAGLASPWEKIQAVCRYVQKVNYVSINTDLSQGGGYRPFPAATIYSRNAGDCKDKTCLLRAMLACLEVTSYAVACQIDHPFVVQPSWPSPIHFNHCITAFVPPAGIAVPAAVDVPGLGRLVIFDPTDEYTPLGYLHDGIAGSDVLIESALVNGLTTLPWQERAVSLRVEAKLDELGALQGSLTEVTRGPDAVRERALRLKTSASDYQRILDAWLADDAPGTTVTQYETLVDDAANSFTTELSFASPRFGKRLGSSRLIIKPFVAVRRISPPEAGKNKIRELPIEVPVRVWDEEVVLTLPEGFVVEELPKIVRVQEAYGEIEVSYTEEAGRLISRRKVRLHRSVLPASDYEQFLTFFRAQLQTLQGRVVLKRA